MWSQSEFQCESFPAGDRVRQLETTDDRRPIRVRSGQFAEEELKSLVVRLVCHR